MARCSVSLIVNNSNIPIRPVKTRALARFAAASLHEIGLRDLIVGQAEWGEKLFYLGRPLACIEGSCAGPVAGRERLGLPQKSGRA